MAVIKAIKTISPNSVSSTKYSAEKLFSKYSGCNRYSAVGRDRTECTQVYNASQNVENELE